MLEGSFREAKDHIIEMDDAYPHSVFDAFVSLILYPNHMGFHKIQEKLGYNNFDPLAKLVEKYDSVPLRQIFVDFALLCSTLEGNDFARIRAIVAVDWITHSQAFAAQIFCSPRFWFQVLARGSFAFTPQHADFISDLQSWTTNHPRWHAADVFGPNGTQPL